MELARSIIGEEPTMQSEIKTWRLLHRRRPISIGPNGFFSLFLATTLFVSLGLFSGQKWTGRLSLFRRIPGARWPHSPPGDVTAGQIICTAKMKQRKIPPMWHGSSWRTDSNWILFCFATGFLNFKNKKKGISYFVVSADTLHNNCAEGNRQQQRRMRGGWINYGATSVAPKLFLFFCSDDAIGRRTHQTGRYRLWRRTRQ